MKYLAIGSMFLMGFGVILEPGLAHGQDTDARQDSGSIVTLLGSSDADTRCQAQKRILKERNNMIAELVALIDDPGNQFHRPDSVEKAMETLGAIQAIDRKSVV